MTENAVLLVTRPALLLERAGGLTVIERHALTARRAGITRLWIGAPRPDEKTLSSLRLPEGFLSWSSHQASNECPTPYLLLSGDHFIRVETLRHIVQAPYRVHATLEDAAGTAVVQVIPNRSPDDKIPAPQRQPLPAGSSVYLEPPVSGGPTLSWLLATGTKSQDGFMARHFDRFISLAISRRLLDTPVTPNMMTVASALLGFIGSSFFLVPTHAARLGGAVLIWLHSVLDGCDGELARVRFQESPLGGMLDFWSDNLVHLALFGCMAWGFYIADQSVLPLILGLASAIGTLGSALLVYRERRGRNMAAAAAEGDGIESTLTKVENALAARDFIYLLLFLAYVDRGQGSILCLYSFLWATAIGSLLFFSMMLYLGRAKNEQTSQPHPPREGDVGDPSAGNGGGHQHIYSGR
jgi:phosphatidylglycerophosphate synthase